MNYHSTTWADGAHRGCRWSRSVKDLSIKYEKQDRCDGYRYGNAIDGLANRVSPASSF